jgi:hypothetical protein
MTRHQEDSDVEQILFGLTGKGIGPLGWSSGLNPDDVRRWDTLLSRYNRLSPTYIRSAPWLPDRAFSYFEFQDGSAALLARFRTRELGRNNSHALVGKASALAPYAMFLSEWDGWRQQPDERPLMSVSQDRWYHLRTRWIDDALLSAGTHRVALATLVRAVLATHSAHFAVLNHEDPLPLLTLTRGVLDPVLSAAGDEFSWTYSTYEVSDTIPEASPQVQEAPRFWCVRSRPDSGETERCRVEVDQAIEDDRFAALAMDLVEEFCKDPSQFRSDVDDRLARVRGRQARIAELLQEPRTRSKPPHPSPKVAHRQSAQESSPRPDAREPWRGASPQVARPHQGNPDPVNHRRERHWLAGPIRLAKTDVLTDVHGILDELTKDGLSPDVRRTNVEKLRKIWDSEDRHYVNAGRMLRRFEGRLRRHGLALALTVVISFLTAFMTWIFWPVPVPPPSPVVVTVTTSPAAAPNDSDTNRPGGRQFHPRSGE